MSAPVEVEAASLGPPVLLACDFFLKYTLGLAQGLESVGCQVTVLGRDHAAEFGGDHTAVRSDLHRRLSPEADVRLLRGRARDIGALRHVAAASGQRSAGPRVVHLQDGVVNDPRLLVAARVRPRGFALTVHDPVPHPGDPRPGARKRVLRAALLGSAAVVFVHGYALRDELRASSRVHAAIEVIPHGVDAPTVMPLPAEPCLLLFGRLSRYKGADVLFDAMPQVWERVPAARLVVAGEGSLPEHPVLADERVTVHNEHIPETAVGALFAQATAVVLPYRQASQSGVGSLAKTHGRATIVTDVGGLPELVADGSGLVVPSERPRELARAAHRVLSDRGLAQRLGIAGARSAGSEASWARVGQLTLEAYRRHGLLAGKALPASLPDGARHGAVSPSPETDH
jgi:glycosyltransferase involved in cell wall biosynthesis